MAGETHEVSPGLVLVVGGGPTGLTAANLLGRYGVPTLLVERHATTSDEAKAISLDDESLRTLQVADLDAAMEAVIMPGTGTRYYGASGQPLLHARGPRHGRLGHSFKNPFAQPEFERVLREGLERYPHVESRFSTELLDLVEDQHGIRATLRDVRDSGDLEGPTSSVRAMYVLGCDGGRSKVRELTGIEMSGRSFTDLWLVADTLEDTHDSRYGMHVGDPARPHVIVAGRHGRCRYEFKLQPGEAPAGSHPPFALVEQLVSRYRTLTPAQLERSVVYGFHDLIAERFRSGRSFLLGDAAHLMPPFAGQGLNSGVRDANNLCWKISEVVQGRAGDELLDSYDVERRCHVRATIDLSVRLGAIVMTSSRLRARVRDAVMGLATTVPWSRRWLEEMRYRPSSPVREGCVVTPTTGPARQLVGRPLEQPIVLCSPDQAQTRLDDVLGPGFAVLGVDLPDSAWDRWNATSLSQCEATRVDVLLDDRVPGARHGRLAVADVGGHLQTMLGHARGHFVVVRPDRFVAAACLPGDVGATATALESVLGTPEPTAPPCNPSRPRPAPPTRRGAS